MRAILTIFIGKVIFWSLRIVGRNGSAFPGKIVEKIYPALLEQQLKKLPEGYVIITGTNGKTTTTKAVSYLLRQCSKKVLTNRTGSNFTRGIYSLLVRKSSLAGSLPYDIAILELDEAYSRIIARRIAPRAVVALNVMRDQLDRYGEIDATAGMIGETISRATDFVVLNRDDQRVASLAEDAQGEVEYFGVVDALRGLLPDDDSLHAAEKNRAVPIGPPESKPFVELADYTSENAAFRINKKLYRSRLAMSGLHNAANVTAALAAALKICPDMEPQFMVPAVAGITSAFGRGEQIELDEKKLIISLVKNPSGFRQSMKALPAGSYDTVMFAINDNYADGRDVSWLWDVTYSGIASAKVVTSGIRAADMSLRLQYDAVEVSYTNSDLAAALEYIIDTTKECSVLFCTYSAMLEIRQLIAKRTELEGVW